MTYPLLPALESFRSRLDFDSISVERKTLLLSLTAYLKEKLGESDEAYLNFICTHNSRRSQFSQIWGQTAAYFYGLNVQCFSGGVEVTAFNERAVASIKRTGFQLSAEGTENPKYQVSFSETGSISTFSKLFDDPINKVEHFAAVMTCAHADENCPFIPGTEQRIPLRYEDPKAFDDTTEEEMKYDERSKQIATELFYAFSEVNNK